MTPSRSRFPLVRRILAGFFLGIAFGLAASRFAPEALPGMLAVVSPFGAVLVSMLKMVVYPIIFFSLVLGTASMPLRSSGRIGGAVVAWYFATSLVATVFGVAMALALDPAMTAAAETAGRYMDGVKALSASSAPEGFGAFLTGLFGNPFAALAEGRFLPIIVFAILFGLAARTMLDEGKNRASVEAMLRTCDGVQHAAFKLIDWVMAYFPFGVFALTFCNFAENGTLLFGPYLRIVFCILAGVSAMILAVYPLAVALLCRENPYRVLFRLRQALLTAFVTRSSAATLPVSFRAMDEVGVPRSLSSFSLPLGATVNMDGVCVHLPVFVILAANMFGLHLSAGQLGVLVVSVMFASIGAGGIPGGSVFLLFMVLENLGLEAGQVATIVALALGINPVLDMFETCCNVAGDNVCTYIVARRAGMISEPPGGAAE
ncbi:MAG: dicarboxylate/amino acid:cation symporter [Kiritimatiellae bacterium]|nr:dicarboxylate/amino acid:cation symporter [Kiritimatiellia bacterium]